MGREKKQDVINELAGHELSHLWWGTSKMAPDQREGAAMLTETLAMYTELMLAKKMYGKQRAIENVNMHLGIYLDERGLGKEKPLYRADPDQRHILYSKGVVVMHQLTETIGEEKVNMALSRLMQYHSWPNQRAISEDFIRQLYYVSDPVHHVKIDDLFKRITMHKLTVKHKLQVKKGLYELQLVIDVAKYNEDGNGYSQPQVFTDSIDVAITSKSGNIFLLQLPVRKNKADVTIPLTEMPEFLEIDPGIKIIRNRLEKIFISKTNGLH